MDEHSEGEPRRVGEVAAERLRRLGKATAVSTGFDKLDRMAGGFSIVVVPGQLRDQPPVLRHRLSQGGFLVGSFAAAL